MQKLLAIVAIVLAGIGTAPTIASFWDSPALVWTLSSANFSDSGKYFYSLSFLNIGQTVAEKVYSGLYFPSAKITERDYQMNQKPLESLVTRPPETNNDNEYTIVIEYLNEGQGGSMSVAVEPHQSGVPQPSPVLFGRNANGEEASFGGIGKVTWWKAVVTAVSLSLAAITLAIIVTFRATSWYRLSRPTGKPGNR